MQRNWTESPAHLDLLSKFSRCREISQVMDWQYLKDSLGEGTKKVMDRFISLGLLVPCTAEESLNRILTVADVKPLLRDRGLKTSGKKAQLIARLVQGDPDTASQLVAGHRFMKCSDEATAIIEDFEANRSAAETQAKQMCYGHLMSVDIKAAYRANVEFIRQFKDPSYSPHDYQAREIEKIMNTHPDSLAAWGGGSLRRLQAAVAMTKLWYGEEPTDWLDTNALADRDVSEQALAHLGRAVELSGRYAYDDGYEYKVKVVFSPYDLDSCDICKGLDGKVFSSRNLPNMPLRGCTSKTGCMCELESVWDDQEMQITVSLDDLLSEQSSSRDSEDVVERMSKLDRLLNSGLITKEEYAEKRQEILDEI